MARWYEEYPVLFEEERQGLEDLGFELDVSDFAAGRVVFRGSIPWDGSNLALVVVYPDAFPYLRPEVFAPDLKLRRHQNPFRGNLCLLDRDTSAWDVDSSGAWLVSKRVPLLLGLLEGNDSDQMRAAEAPQGEPASKFFRTQTGAVVFLPASALELPPDVLGGTLRLAVGQGEDPAPNLRACISKVQAHESRQGKRRVEGSVLAAADKPLQDRFARTALEGTWVRFDEWPLEDGSAEALWHTARATPSYREPPWQNVQGGKIQILGIVAKEEVRQDEYEDSWLFALRFRQRNKDVAYLVHGERISRADLAERIPSITGLGEKVVALTGLGALGAPIAMEFARGMLGELRVLDDDVVEVGTTVRWPLGILAVGHPKVSVIAQGLPVQYPYTAVRPFGHRIGAVSVPGEPPPEADGDVIERLLDGADLLVDATAELGVQYYLEGQAHERGLPQIYAWMTEGGYGGAVARVVPGQTGCWLCLQWHLEEGTIPTPPRAKTGQVQPRGCAEPTFTGTGFDALPVIAQTMRVATHTVLHGRNPEENGVDVFVCSQIPRGADAISVPTWTQHKLSSHPRCERCAITA